jgi:DNA-binding IclR family transcriptional regulator
MILAELRSYLTEHRRVSLADMANRFDTDADALRGMLATLERKGRVRKLPPGTRCYSACCGCDQASPELYEWVSG